MFCESLSEFLKLNRTIKKLDISCNFIDDSNASTLKDSLESNTNIIEVDVRNNLLSPPVEREINEIVTKNLLLSKNIPYQKVPDRKYNNHFLNLIEYISRYQMDANANPAQANANQAQQQKPAAATNASANIGGDQSVKESPVKATAAE
jgi:hypothetical protein